MRKTKAIVVVAALLLVPSAAGSSSKSAAGVLDALRKQGMPINGFVVYNETTDVNHLLGRPGQYVSKVNFHDSRVPRVKDYDVDGGGSIETFKNRADATRRFRYMKGFGTTSLFAEYDYLSGTVLLRLSHVLTPKQAAAYAAALARVT